MTTRLYLTDNTLASGPATILSADATGIILDQTIFYPRAGGQPGDTGLIRWSGGETPITDTTKGEGETVLHIPAGNAPLPPPGTTIEAALDWPRRHRHMRMHTTLHLLCSLLPGAAVTGGQIGEQKSRLDFDLPVPPARDELQARLDELIRADHPITADWVDEAVLDERPDLVRTLSVKPPRGAGRIRLVRIGTGDTLIDLQPCGGTHVRSTGEIGAIGVVKIENKGRQNRRISIAFPEAT